MPEESLWHWIDGERYSGAQARTAPVTDPARGKVIRHVPLASPDEVARAVDSARRAFESWSATSLSRRTRVLFRFRELLERSVDRVAALITEENGKTLDDARGEIQRGLEVVEFAAGVPTHLLGGHSDEVSTGVEAFSVREPLGVIASISPFNFPAMVPLWTHPVAIATGNTVVLKPSERVPSAALVLAQLWQEAGLPDGVFNVVHGDRTAVEALVTHPDVAGVSFVGSTPAARHVAQIAGAEGKRVQALGGAKNHAVVLPDADLAAAADHLTAAACGSAGQRCMAVSVAIAVGGCADELADLLQQRMRAVVVGPGHAAGSQIGPLISAEARDRVVRAVAAAPGQGAKILLDGRETTDIDREGYFFGPTLVDHVTEAADVYREELFGPVLCLVRTETLDDAIDLINRNPYGNGTAIFTGSGAAAHRFRRRVHVGMIGVNVPIPVPVAYYSFGGWNDSLFGEHKVYGPDGIRFYTREKAITQRWFDALTVYHFPTSS